MASGSNSLCSHSETTIESSGTEEISVCVRCGLSVSSNKFSVDAFCEGNFPLTSFMGSEFDQKLSPKLKASITRSTVKSCEEFTLGKNTQNNIKLFLYNIYCKDNGYRPTARERMAIIVWYIHQECIKERKWLPLKDICYRLAVNPTLVTKVKKKLKELCSVDHRCHMAPKETFLTLISELLGESVTSEEKQSISDMCVRLFGALAESAGTFADKRNHLPFQEAIFHSVVEHYCFKAASRFPALKPPSSTAARYVCGIRKELVRMAQNIPYISSLVCVPSKVLRVLDSILKYSESVDSPPAMDDPPSFAELSSERAKLVERVLRDLSDSTPELGVEGGKDSTPELGVEGGKDSTPELGVERGKDSTPELGVEGGKDSTPELGVERDKDSTSELSVEGGKGTMPRLDKEESIVAELLRRDFKPDVICNWPSSLRKLLDFSRQGDIAAYAEDLTKEDLGSEEEEEYIISESESKERAKLWEKCVLQN